MKKILLLPACCLLMLLCCHKGASLPANTIQADIDGVSETFNVSINAGYVLSGPYRFKVAGYSKSGTAADMVQIEVGRSDGTVITGTYTYQHQPSTNPTGTVLFHTGPTDVDYTPDETQPQPAVVTFTVLTNHNIQGTFSGNLLGTDGKTKTVTNGMFNVNF